MTSIGTLQTSIRCAISVVVRMITLVAHSFVAVARAISAIQLFTRISSRSMKGSRPRAPTLKQFTLGVDVAVPAKKSQSTTLSMYSWMISSIANRMKLRSSRS